jgi:hypothetical protein
MYLHLQLVHLGLNGFGIGEVNHLISTQAWVGKGRAHSHAMTLVPRRQPHESKTTMSLELWAAGYELE